MLDQGPVAEGDELARHVDGDVHLRLAGVRAEVRRDDHPRVLDQPADHLAPRRLLAPRVDRRAGHVAGIERGQQITLVHDAAPRAVHDPHAALGERQLARGHHVLGLRRERHVEGDDVRLAQERLVVREPRPEIFRAGLGDIGIVDEQLGLERA